MRSCILCVHFETSSLWAEFVNKNRCISVRLVSKEVKIILIIHIIDFLCERWIPCQAVTSVLCLHYHPETVHQYKRCVHFWNNFLCITSLLWPIHTVQASNMQYTFGVQVYGEVLYLKFYTVFSKPFINDEILLCKRLQ